MPDFAGSGQVAPNPDLNIAGASGPSAGEELKGSVPVKTTGILWPPR